MFKIPSRRKDDFDDDDGPKSGEGGRHGGAVDDAADGPTAGHAGAMLSALFLVVFAIAVIVPWTVADSARQNTYAEAQALTEAFWAAGGLPETDTVMVRDALRDYTAFVADAEWKPMAEGRLDSAGWARLDALRQALDDLDLSDREQITARDDVEDQLTEIFAARRQRAVDAATSLPAGVLALNVVTAGLVLAFPLLAGARPRGKVKVTYLLMALSLGVSVYLVFAINHTFTGPLGVDNSAFRTAQQEFARVP
ncbi:DUF4239 domain-containing protein [Actinocorallia sp. API 0066]|uniref:bestrophin-like domain n=1 Tax=Actinocorallia sp. API 0066 TaxID=2896846 RepID=UPI001E2F8FC8|nr:DUF4239 domain-containing protein [Actinocorallia sp. API 0066]MCD0451416.1 DUF4239 domain-containing protein [Actinocorallia sp. API 0066]